MILIVLVILELLFGNCLITKSIDCCYGKYGKVFIGTDYQLSLLF